MFPLFIILAGDADGFIQFRMIQSRLILRNRWFIRDYYKKNKYIYLVMWGKQRIQIHVHVIKARGTPCTHIQRDSRNCLCILE